jgi:hypothetical protein
MDIQKQLSNIEQELLEIKSILKNKVPISDWLTWKQAMAFIGYKETSMRELEKKGLLQFNVIGRKKFIKKCELESFLENLSK